MPHDPLSFLRRCLPAVVSILVAACGGASGVSDSTPSAGAESAMRDATALAATWVSCASEGATCSFSGTRSVRYGTDTLNVVKTYTGSVVCSNTNFGDPAPGSRKSCWYDSSTTVSTTTGTTSTSTTTTSPTAAGTTWTVCASEGGTCAFTGSRTVRFGTATANVTRTLTGPVACSTAVFGDPAYGTAKQCWLGSTTTTSTTTTTTGGTTTGSTGTTAATFSYCTWEGGTCTFSGTREVRFGTATLYTTKVFAGSVLCSNAAFGDPAPNQAKSCSVSSQTTTAAVGSTTGGTTGGTTGTTTTSPTTTTTTTTTTTPITTTVGTTASTGLNLTACVPSGVGRDYQVGEGSGQIPTLDQVPWEGLAAGDTVRIFYKSTPYRGKILVAAKGTTSAPVRVCGVKSASGQRPVIDGAGAVARRGLSYSAVNVDNIQEARAVVLVDRLGSQDWGSAFPTNIQIDGLEIRGAKPGNTFTNAFGATQAYVDFGGCIWLERGHNLTVVDNVIYDCTNGIFSKSVDGGDFLVTKNVRIAGNTIYGNGVVGDEHQHNTYIQSIGVVYEFNRYGPLRAGALGNAIKDRSVGTVVRFNRIEEGAHAIDLVEAEDFPAAALADPAYRTAFVYGNQIIKSGNTGSFIHYGGDHYGSTAGANWGEPLFRRGTLYFFHNSIQANGTMAALFQLATTLERAEVWNNAFVFAPTVTYPSLRMNSEVGAGWTAGGVLSLGRNWITAGWGDTDPWHTIPGQVLGAANLITSGVAQPLDASTFVPVAGSAVVDGAQANLSAVGVHAVNYQVDASGWPRARSVVGAAADLGAVER